MPAPLIFQQSMEFLDAEGKSIRYRTYYFDKLPEQKLGRRGGGAERGSTRSGRRRAPCGRRRTSLLHAAAGLLRFNRNKRHD